MTTNSSYRTGHKIPIIENLGVAGPQDAIDFTDNDITTIGNFPLSPRLNTLLVARNRVQNVDKRLGESLPNLTTLVLTSNVVRELGDIEGLGTCGRLTHLTLTDNPVTKKEVCRHPPTFSSPSRLTSWQHYRHFLIHLVPSLRFIDYQKVKDVEREQAKELFGTRAEPTELAAKIRGVKSNTFDVSGGSTTANTGRGKAMRTQLTDNEKKKVQSMIKNARSLAEIAKIEKDLAEGRIPQGAADADRMVP